MPEICRFFGIIIRMYFNEHEPPHFHAEYQGKKAVFDFNGNIIKGSLASKTATKLVRDWVDLRFIELNEDWGLARDGKEIKKIEPLI
jgi:hypothetical protein